MSAFVGLFHRDGAPVSPERLQPMVDILAHRGPDWAGIWHSGPVGLGNRMLWTTKASQSEQMPTAHASGSLVITADARLDNRDELWSFLGRGGPLDESLPDSDLILAAYDRWGEDCPRYLLGDFAFIIWDGRQRRLFCARDPLGVKPFYYHISDRLFAAASEIKGILQLPTVDRRLDEHWIGDYLTGTWLDKTYTVYQSIRRLAPAHSMSVSASDLVLKRYWELDPTRELPQRSEQEYVDGFRDLFFDAVRCRINSTYPVGSLLSGGMDSSSITCVARHLKQNNGAEALHSFSAFFSASPESDEREYFDTVLAQGGLQAHCIDVSPVGSLSEHDRMAWHLDQPLIGYNAHLGWTMLRHAREAGVRVLLDGTDGDSTVSYGNGYLRDLAAGWRWPTLFSELCGHRRIHGTPVFGPFLTSIWRYGLNPHIPGKIKAPKRFLGSLIAKQSSEAEKSERWPVLRSEFMQRIDIEGKMAAHSRSQHSHSAREAHWKVIDAAPLPLLLEVEDHSAHAFGIDQRYPFCDRRLVEYCLALPTGMKLHHGLSRYVVRRALSDLLPRKIAERSGKADLTDVFKHSLFQLDAPLIGDLMSQPMNEIASFINESYVKELYHRWLSGSAHVAENRIFWRVAALLLWMNNKC